MTSCRGSALTFFDGIILSILCLSGIGVAPIISRPRNILTLYGQPTTLECCSNNSIVHLVWRHQRGNREDLAMVCRGSECPKNGYSIDNHTQGCFHLVITSTTFDASGLYQCSEAGTGNVVGAYVVAYNFSCSDNKDSAGISEGDTVISLCNISWKGKLPFESRWLTSVGTELNTTVHAEEKEFYTSSLRLEARRPFLLLHSVELWFLSEGVRDDNVDRFCPTVRIWMSTEEPVMYAVSDVRLSCPVEDCQRRVGELINCSADGYPSPRFRWLNWNRKEVADGPVLKLTSSEAQNFICVASNEIRGSKYELDKRITVSIKEYVDDRGKSKDNYIFIVIVIVILFIIVFLLVAVLVILKVIHQILLTVVRNENQGTTVGVQWRRTLGQEEHFDRASDTNKDEAEGEEEEEEEAASVKLLSPVQVADSDIEQDSIPDTDR